VRLDLHNSPTALNKRGNKVYMDGYRFDSQKECDFYAKFIRDSGVKFDIHPRYELLPLKELGVYKTRSISYTPDVVTYGDEGEITHVYDVKNSFTPYGIDTSVKLRFALFARRYGIPVEAVVLRAHDFKSIAMGITKQRKTNQPLVCGDVFYDWRGAMG
jgi:hypothetical protein